MSLTATSPISQFIEVPMANASVASPRPLTLDREVSRLLPPRRHPDRCHSAPGDSHLPGDQVHSAASPGADSPLMTAGVIGDVTRVTPYRSRDVT